MLGDPSQLAGGKGSTKTLLGLQGAMTASLGILGEGCAQWYTCPDSEGQRTSRLPGLDFSLYTLVRETGMMTAIETQPLKNVAWPGLAPWPTPHLKASQKVIRRGTEKLTKGEIISEVKQP